MTKKCIINAAQGYIYVANLPSRVLTTESAIRRLPDIEAMAINAGYKRVAIEGKRPKQINSTTALYTLAEAFVSHGLLGIHFAFVFFDHVHDEMTRFFETATLNRGIRIAFFNERTSALAWLGVDVLRSTED